MLPRAVLVAIAIPIFTSQLEKSREATDLANMRAVYAELTTAALTETTAGTTDTGCTVTVSNGVVTVSKTYTPKQAVAGWVTDNPEVADLVLTDAEAPAKGAVNMSATSTGTVTIGTVKKNAD